MTRSLITLTTDFGTSDYYVAAMKAVILSVDDQIRLVDLSHDIKAQDIMAAAWVLKHSAYLFPEGTVHLAVIDPGVGTERKPVAVKHRGQFFIGPDNGLFSLVSDNEPVEAIELDKSEHWRVTDPSATFHGRDIFAQVAAKLSTGTSFDELGSPLQSLEVYHWAQPTNDKYGLQGWVVHIDRFGNLMTNIPKSMITNLGANDQLRIYVGTQILRGIASTYGSVPEGEAVALIGSTGTLEVAVYKGNAAEMLGVYQGAAVSVLLERGQNTAT